MVHWRPQVDHGHPQERGEAYIVPAGGGGKVMRSPGKKVLLYAGYFYYFSVCGGGAFLLRFSLRWGSQGTDARTNVCRGGGGGVGKPKKDHHKNIKGPPPPHNKKSSRKGPHMEKKSLKDPICMEIKIAKRPPQAAW